ncbi:MAG: hypothetical protein H6727_05585 [Myxococcales bacterium]|nr:hypothetical protein [Myxococcales bacterium]
MRGLQKPRRSAAVRAGERGDISGGVLAVLALVMCCVVGAVGYIGYRQFEENAMLMREITVVRQDLQRAKRNQARLRQGQAAVLLQSAADAYRDQRLQDASMALVQALSLTPERADLLAWQTRLGEEQKMQDALRKAQKASDAGRHVEVVKLISEAEMEMPGGSLFANALMRLKRKSQAALWTKSMTSAKAMLQRAKKRRRDRQPEAKEEAVKMEEMARNMIKKLEEERDDPRTCFNAGKLTDARVLLKKARAKEKLEAVDEFERMYRQGWVAHQRRNPSRAVPALSNARRLDREIGGGQSVYTMQIARMLGNMRSLLGLYALSQSRYGQAASHFRSALVLYPRQSMSTLQLQALRKRAKSWLQEAEQRKTAEPKAAGALAQRVLFVVEGDDELAQKAQKLLSAVRVAKSSN